MGGGWRKKRDSFVRLGASGGKWCWRRLSGLAFFSFSGRDCLSVANEFHSGFGQVKQVSELANMVRVPRGDGASGGGFGRYEEFESSATGGTPPGRSLKHKSIRNGG